MKRVIFLFFILFINLNSYSQKNKQYKIVVLHSYHFDFWWVNEINEGIKKTINVSDKEIIINYEYLGYRSASGSQEYNDPIISDYLNAKYSQIELDAMIIADNSALNFIKEQKLPAFKDLPKVFCGINYYLPSLIEGIKNITGVRQDNAIEENIKLIKRIHPSKNKLLILAGDDVTSNAFKQTFYDLEPNYPELKFEYFSNFTMEDLKAKLQELPDNYSVYYTTFKLDANRRYVPDEVSIEMCRKNSENPVYCDYQYYINKGLTGGYVVSGVKQGELAASILINVLNGVDINSIPIIQDYYRQPIFNYKMLKKHDIDITKLPKKSIILQKPELNLKEFVKTWWYLAVILVFAIIYIAFQKNKNNKIKGINKDLKFLIGKKTNEVIKAIDEIELIFNSRAMGIIRIDDFKIVRANERACEIFGYTLKDLIGRHIYDLHINIQKANEFIIEAEKKGNPFMFTTYPFRHKNKKEIILQGSGSVQVDNNRMGVWFFNELNNSANYNKGPHEEISANTKSIHRPLKQLKVTSKNIISKLPKSSNISKEMSNINRFATVASNVLSNSIHLQNIELKKHKIRESEIEILSYIKGITNKFKENIKLKSIDVEIRYNKKLINSKHKVFIKGDRTILNIIFSNLVLNSFESTTNDKIRIDLISSPHLHFSIHTNSTIPSDLKATFFDKDKSSEKAYGINSGAYCVKKSCEYIGADLSMITSSKMGTYLKVNFPKIQCYDNI